RRLRNPRRRLFPQRVLQRSLHLPPARRRTAPAAAGSSARLPSSDRVPWPPVRALTWLFFSSPIPCSSPGSGLGSPDPIGVRGTTSSSPGRRIREVAVPAERRQRGHEEVLTATQHAERADVVDTAPDRIAWDRERRPVLLQADVRVAFVAEVH